MTTKAVDAKLPHTLGDYGSIGIIASDIVFEGSLVGENGSGYGRPLVDGDRFLGIATEQCDNSLVATDGAKNIRYLTKGRFEIALAGLVTDVGNAVYASDDNAFSFDPANTYIGKITRYVTAAILEIEIDPGGQDEWGNRSRVTKTDDYTTLVTDSGMVVALGTDAKTITLIATQAGIEVTIVNIAADGVSEIHVDPNASDLFIGGSGQAAGADGKKLSNTKATARRGDFLRLMADGTNGWHIIGKRGTWLQET